MRLLSLHIENFGKLHDIDFSFNSSLNQILQENGWGKTTLSIFIKTMFYGMPAKTRGDDVKSIRSKYNPWQGGIYGGYIEYEIGETRFRVTRTFGKTPESDTYQLLDYSTNKVLSQEFKPLGETIFGLGEESFQLSAFFPQLNFKSLANIEMTASLTGVNKYQDDLNGIEKAIKRLKDKRLEIKRELPSKSDIEKYRFEINNIKALNDNIQTQIAENKKQSKILDEELKNYAEKIKVEEEKYSEQNKLYSEKLQIESKANSLSEQLNGLYQKHSEIQAQLIENNIALKNSKINKKFVWIDIAAVLVLLAVMLALYLTKTINLTIFISTIVTILLIGGISLFFIYYLNKRHKNEGTKYSEGESLNNNFKQNIEMLKEQIDNLKKVLSEKYNNIEMPNIKPLKELQELQNEKRIKLLQINNKIENLNNDLDTNLGRDGYLKNLLESSKTRLEDMQKRLSIIEKTIEYLLKAKDIVSSRYVGEINEDFKNILQKFDVTSERFMIDSEWNVSEQTNVGNKNYEYSSQGYQDIISFCQRISLIYKIYKEEKPFIVLDDTFVNLDDKMLGCAKEIVNQLSKDYQIIYICCNTRCSLD